LERSQLEAAIRTKRAAGRPKDLEAIAELEVIWEEQQEVGSRGEEFVTVDMFTLPILRTATIADAAAVSNVYLASRKALMPFAPLVHSDAAVRRWMREHLIPTGRVIVAIQDGVIVGMMALTDDEAVGWIDQLYVHPRAVRCGIGTQLLESAKTALGSPIRLYTFQANVGARRFYERHGFRAMAFGDGTGNEEQCPDILYEWRL
jgi:GNAT superfamily N-acetyltransferase